MPIMSCDIIGMMRGGVCYTGGSVMESYQFEILDQYFSVIVTIPHISIKTQSLCTPTYFSVYLKPREVIIMHKIHKYLKTFLSSRQRRPWHHTIMASAQSNFWLWQAFNSIQIHPTLNLRPGLNSAAFSTYIVKFPAFKLVSFMAYTYNIWGQWDRTRRPLSAQHPV